MAEKCGGVWKKQKKDGEVFLSIQIGDRNYVAWKNDKGDNPKRPDFTVYPSEPRDGQQQTPRAALPSQPNAAVQAVNNVFVDDIPF